MHQDKIVFWGESFMGNLRRIVSIVISTAFVQSTTFVAAPALAKPADSVRSEKKGNEEALTELYDILRPAREFETVSEIYYRASPYLAGADLAFFGDRFGKNAMERAPSLSRQGDAIIVQQKGAPEIKIQLNGTEDNLELRFNNEAISMDETLSPRARLQNLQNILNKSEKKSGHASILLHLLIPQAHAFDWMQAGVIGLAVAGIAYMYISNKQKQKKAEKLAKQCSQMIPTCYVYNGAYVLYPNACGAKEMPGYLSLGMGSACPTTSSTTSATANTYVVPTATPTPVTTTPITLPASTTGQQ